MKKYYFTFGSNHTVPETKDFKDSPMQGRSLGRSYVTIEADDENTARQMMFARYGAKWSFSYNESQFDDCIAKYHLTEFEKLVQETQTV